MTNNLTIKVLLADDHTLVREGLAMLLRSLPSLELVGQVSNGADLVRAAAELKPHVVITDLRMPVMTGTEALREISSWNKGIHSMIISMYDDEYSIVGALEAGAIGYIIKNAEKEEFLDAVKNVYEGHPYYCKSTSVNMVRMLARSPFDPYRLKKDELPGFSLLEMQIARLICKEISSQEMAEALLISKKKVDFLRANILKKMQVKTAAGVAIYALKNNLFSMDEQEYHIEGSARPQG